MRTRTKVCRIYLILILTLLLSLLGVLSPLMPATPVAADATSIGPGATDRASTVSNGGYTMLALGNPATGNIPLDTFHIWSADAMTGVKIGLFYLISGNYTCRYAATISGVTGGLDQSFSISWNAVAGDVIGIYTTNGDDEYDSSGAGLMYISGDQCTVGATGVYTPYIGDISIYATGGVGGSTPTVTTGAASSVTMTSATVSGNITIAGSTNVTAVFVQFAPTTGDIAAGYNTANISKSVNQADGVFAVDMPGLFPSTTYYYRMGATDTAGNGYGMESSFTTSDNVSTPTVTSGTASAVGTTTAIVSANLTSSFKTLVIGDPVPCGTNITASEDSGIDVVSYNSHVASANETVIQYAFWTSSTGGTRSAEVGMYTIVSGNASALLASGVTVNIPVMNLGWMYSSVVSQAMTVGSTYGVSIGNFHGNPYFYKGPGPAPEILVSYQIGTLPEIYIQTNTESGRDYLIALYTTPVNATARRVQWGTSSGVYTNTVTVTESVGVGEYSVGITELPPDTTIYALPGFLNASGIWGDGIEINFHTLSSGPSAPTITTSATTAIQATTATLNGNITVTGGENPTVTIYYGTIDEGSNPLLWQHTVAPTSPSQPQGVAPFTYGVIGLSSGTPYYTIASATNSGGTSWATTQSFLTKPAAPTNVVATKGTSSSNVTITWIKSTGATDYHVWRDSTDLGSIGDVDTFADIGAAASSITAGSSLASDGTSNVTVSLGLLGASFNNGTTYTYKVVANNATGNSIDSATDTGYRGYSSPSYQWQQSASDDIAAIYSNLIGAITATWNDTTGVFTPDGRWYRCVLNATGAIQQISIPNRGYLENAPTPTPSIPITNNLFSTLISVIFIVGVAITGISIALKQNDIRYVIAALIFGAFGYWAIQLIFSL